jgi:hypothetical protein
MQVNILFWKKSLYNKKKLKKYIFIFIWAVI